ncbi:MAG: DNA-binding response regulator [Acidimicrobiales bacterium]|nr:DNA-binding response regulator [Acidimicrobiales bacterium]
MARRILVVEDEAPIADAVAARLRSEGFEVRLAADGPTGVAQAQQFEPDLVLLDLMLPGLDGLEVCRRIQRDRHVPVMMLTARDDETDLVIGLAVGADDYLTKPFSMRELVARVQALLRRVDALEGRVQSKVLHIDEDIEVDLDARRVRQRGEVVHLTPTEFDLLVGLAERPGRILTRERLLVDVWGYRDGSGARTVDSHVRALRRKLGDNVVRTVHGVGYGLGEAHLDQEADDEVVDHTSGSSETVAAGTDEPG